MLVSRLDEKNYIEILDLIKAKSIEEIEIKGIENFPKDGGKYKRKNSGTTPKNKLRRDSHSNKKKHNTENNIESKNLSSKNIEKKDKKAAPKQIEEKTVNPNNDKKNLYQSNRSDSNKKSQEVEGFGENMPAFFKMP